MIEIDNNLNKIILLSFVKLIEKNNSLDYETIEETNIESIREVLDIMLKPMFEFNEFDKITDNIEKVYEIMGDLEDRELFLEYDYLLEVMDYALIKLIVWLSDDKKEELFWNINEEINRNINSISSQHLLEFCMHYLKNTNFELMTYKRVEEAIDKQLGFIDDNHILFKYGLLNKYDSQDILYKEIKFLREYTHFPKVLDIYIEELKRVRNDYTKYDKILELLDKRNELYQNDIDLETILKRIETYILSNDSVNARLHLKKLIFDYKKYDFKYINQLKKSYTKDEWLIERDELVDYFTKEEEYEIINNICLNDAAYDKLCENIINNCSIELLEKYRHLYEKDCSDKIQLFYKDLILNKSKEARNRKKYGEIIEDIKVLKSYPNSKKVADELIAYLKTEYKRRRVFVGLLDEIT